MNARINCGSITSVALVIFMAFLIRYIRFEQDPCYASDVQLDTADDNIKASAGNVANAIQMINEALEGLKDIEELYQQKYEEEVTLGCAKDKKPCVKGSFFCKEFDDKSCENAKKKVEAYCDSLKVEQEKYISELRKHERESRTREAYFIKRKEHFQEKRPKECAPYKPLHKRGFGN